ncbi:hypothetical protein NE684_00775 [Pseudoflavonifractor phocaeensis]|nr:hypothetical protein [Pseudoflavonifractor phocaeensis]
MNTSDKTMDKRLQELANEVGFYFICKFVNTLEADGTLTPDQTARLLLVLAGRLGAMNSYF